MKGDCPINNEVEIVMAKIERFEDLQSWQKGRQLANQIHEFCERASFAIFAFEARSRTRQDR